MLKKWDDKMMKCGECGSTVVLKYTSNFNGVLSKYWKCPVCGATQQYEEKNSDGVLLK